MTNLKSALRALVKTPFVTLVAVLSLALGIGANAAIFSLLHQLLLQPLPVYAPGQLVNLAAPGPKPGSQSCSQAGSCEAVFSYPMFRDLERSPSGFVGIAAHRAFGANLAYRGRTMSAQGMLVSGSYFPLLGLQPAVGRLLGPSDDTTIGGHSVVVLSHAYWEVQLGADPSVLNDRLIVNGQPMTIVGVAPLGFEGTTLGSSPQVFVPLTMRGFMSPGWKGFEDRRNYWAYLFARLQSGVGLEQAAAWINGPYRAIINDVEAPLQEGMSDPTMKRFRARQVVVEPGARGQSSVHGEARAPLLLLMATTLIVLLIACANIANLLLARGATRATEMAVRLSIGASRRHLLGQLLTEACLLSVLGGLAGLLVARWTLHGIVSLMPPQAMHSVALELAWPVVGFTAALALFTGLLFGIFPALHATRPDLASTLKGQAGQPSGHRAAVRFRASIVAVQIALSMALLVSAGLFIRSLWNIARVDLGVKVDDVVTFAVSPELNGYTPANSQALFGRLEEELAALPGVTSVTAALVPLLAGNSWGSDVSVQGFEKGPDTDDNARFNEVGPGYFRTLGIPLLAGREFTPADVTGAPRVAIVNEAFTRKFNLGRDAVGKRMASGAKRELDTEIVGVVQNTKYSEVKQEVPPLFFRPYRQDDEIGAVSFYVRASRDPSQVLRAVPGVVARLDPNLPVEGLKTMPQQVRESVFVDRMIGTLSTAFAVLATLLAAIGLYGVLSYTVAQRTREIGLRMALGADAVAVRRMILAQVARLTLIGGAVGLAAAIALGRLAQSQLFEIKGHDPPVVAVAAMLLVAVALAAGLLPALRASRVDPMRALRYE